MFLDSEQDENNDDIDDDDVYEKELRKSFMTAHRDIQVKPVSQFKEELLKYEQTYLKKRLNSKSSVLQFWKKMLCEYPLLYKVAMVVLAAPAPQVSVERLFSQIKFILNDLRSVLSSKHVENIALVRNNFEHLDQTFFSKVINAN